MKIKIYLVVGIKVVFFDMIGIKLVSKFEIILYMY